MNTPKANRDLAKHKAIRATGTLLAQTQGFSYYEWDVDGRFYALSSSYFFGPFETEKEAAEAVKCFYARLQKACMRGRSK